MNLMVYNQYEPLPEGITTLFERVAAACERVEGLDMPCQAGIRLVGDAEIQTLNREMRGKDAATDVLSFPSITYPTGTSARQNSKRLRREMDVETHCIHLGDIAISIDHVLAQAAEYGHSVEREAGYLLAHGLFHIMGYDHMTETDKPIMRAMEKQAMALCELTREGGISMYNEKKLCELAEKARENAYVPYSHYEVGAALLAKDGRIFTGCNVECASYGMTICAERTATVKAVSEGAREFEAIAINATGSAPFPCGACRQLLYEFSPEMQVIVTWDGHLRSEKLCDLLPEGFGPQSLFSEEKE